MAALWSSQEPMTAAQVHAFLADDALAYKTVLTVLARLYAKGLLERQTAGRAHAYAPRTDAAEHAAEEMNAALRSGPQHSSVLQRFVDGLDPEDQAALRALLGQN